MTEPIKSITLLRHGWSAADDERVHEGRYDSPLTDKGRGQVARLAARWVAERRMIDHLICSPLQRAHETARLLGAALNVEPHPDDAWLEHDNSPVAGLPLEEVHRRFPHADVSPPHTPPFGPGSESRAAMHRRAGAALEQLLTLPGAHVLVVAHGGILNAVMRNIVSAACPPGSGGAWFAFGDTGFTTLQYDVHHRWGILGVNDQLHLR